MIAKSCTLHCVLLILIWRMIAKSCTLHCAFVVLKWRMIAKSCTYIVFCCIEVEDDC